MTCPRCGHSVLEPQPLTPAEVADLVRRTRAGSIAAAEAATARLRRHTPKLGRLAALALLRLMVAPMLPWMKLRQTAGIERCVVGYYNMTHRVELARATTWETALERAKEKL